MIKVDLKLPAGSDTYAVNEFDPAKSYIVTFDPDKINIKTLIDATMNLPETALDLDITFIPVIPK